MATDRGSASSTRVLDPIEMFARTASTMPVNDLPAIVSAAGTALGAASARLLVADYAMLSLHELGVVDPGARTTAIEGTLAGRAFSRDEVVVSGDGPTTVWAPLTQDSERVGVLELAFTSWNAQMLPALEVTTRMLTLVVLSKRRYTDGLFRSRRSEPLSVAAEIQWDLLPPLSCVSDEVSICGMLEPAYSIGGDSFDYALNATHTEFAIVDAVGHGLPAVLKSVLAINALRNARREGLPLETAYLNAGELLAGQWDDLSFVTGQLGSARARHRAALVVERRPPASSPRARRPVRRRDAVPTIAPDGTRRRRGRGGNRAPPSEVTVCSSTPTA